MPRSEARLFNAIWKDSEWRAFSVSARHMYAFLLTQDDLTHCGLIPLREARWARLTGLTVAAIRADLQVLAEVQWAVVDRDTDELLVRSLVRRDKVLLQPLLWVPFSISALSIESALLRAVLLGELVRCRSEGLVNQRVTRRLDDLISDMERHLDSHLPSLAQSHTQRHPATVQGRGYVTVVTNVSPNPVTLAPSPEASPAKRVTIPPAAATATEGEGDSSRSGNPPCANADTLVAEVRSLRPDWSERSIRRVLKSPDVTDRPWPLVVAAFPEVAKDPESKSPGRLAHDGPWWHRNGSAATSAPRPPWCGECDPETRLAKSVTPGARTRCKNCHPLEVQSS